MSTAVRHRTATVHMTEGPILGNIIRFAIPLLIGNLFQQLYNMVDTWVIGQTGNNGAYAAVGSVGPIINILIGFFSGLATGAGVVISQYFGAKDDENVKKCVHTSILLSLILGVMFSVLGVFIAPVALRLMLATEEGVGDVYPYACRYLTIYFSGLLGLLIYNMGAAVLRAVGDSRRPFFFLLVSAVSNTVLDVVFVFGLGLGVEGVAFATLIAQSLAALLVLITLLTSKEVVRVRPRALALHRRHLGQIVRIGIPSAIQMALTAFSNVFVQSYIGHANGVQQANLGGWTGYSKIDHFIFLPAQSLSMSVSTFVGQNLGCGNIDRARRATYITFLTSICITACIILLVIPLAPYLCAIFNSDPSVVRVATLLLQVLTPFYLLTSINQVFSAAMRGAGNSRAPMLIMLCSFVGVRQIYLFITTQWFSNDLLPIAFSYPVGWLACSIGTLLYFRFRFSFEKTRIVRKD